MSPLLAHKAGRLDRGGEIKEWESGADQLTDRGRDGFAQRQEARRLAAQGKPTNAASIITPIGQRKGKPA